jgi:D-beta-D-heptose 7-phosphate kinase/D-beta-D-heptose 1-phosphate adenosyltransferase
MILVIGESCEDVYIYTKSDRLSPEAPVPILKVIKEVKSGGMALNVRNNLESINRDAFVVVMTNDKKITKTRYVDFKSNHTFIRIDDGEEFLDKFNISNIGSYILNNTDLIIISDYNKGFLSDKDIVDICKLNKPTLLDTKRKLTKEILDVVSYVKLNESEYDNNEDIIDDEYLGKVIITMGGDGVLYHNRKYQQKENMRTIDVSGAGDTFTAAFGLKILETNDIEESIFFANEMSSLVVKKRGTSVPFD